MSSIQCTIHSMWLLGYWIIWKIEFSLLFMFCFVTVQKQWTLHNIQHIKLHLWPQPLFCHHHHRTTTTTNNNFNARIQSEFNAFYSSVCVCICSTIEFTFFSSISTGLPVCCVLCAVGENYVDRFGNKHLPHLFKQRQHSHIHSSQAWSSRTPSTGPMMIPAKLIRKFLEQYDS